MEFRVKYLMVTPISCRNQIQLHPRDKVHSLCIDERLLQDIYDRTHFTQ